MQSDNSPDWHNANCTTNLASGVADTDNPSSPPICPIAGSGTDAATPAVDTTNETQGPPGLNNIDGTKSYPAAKTVGKTIADQLVAAKLGWKSYQESLSPNGADLVDYSDGVFDNNTDFSAITPVLNPPLTQSDVVQLYAAKHDPFVYFKSVQNGSSNGANSLANVVDFTGACGLYADLAAGTSPSFSFIAPNQCNDQHGRSNAGPFCNFDPASDGTQASLNPALTLLADATVLKLVTAIHSSRVWTTGNNAIVVVYDENDYSTAPNINQVVLIVDTSYAGGGVQSSNFYTHFSLLKTLELGFGLPCLNHACDKDTAAMADLFAAP